MEDLNALWALYGDPEITKYISDAPKTYEESKKELEWHMNGHPSNPEFGLWSTIHKETSKFIGRCGLLPWTIDGQAEVEMAYTIARDFWGQGFCTEAAQAIAQHGFKTLKLTRLICMIEPENKASLKVALNIGMIFEKEMVDDMGSFHLYSRSNQPKRSIF
ncbi:MAG: GNAT family N-acetyltransferase [Anaerolineales bacterium]|jgi:ribosomal-protein-alanine N-acetyltransferase